MAGVTFPEIMKIWIESFIPEGANTVVIKTTYDEKLNEKWAEYGVLDKLSAKLENGTYALTGNCTVDSVMGKSDDQSTALYDTYIQQEFEACVAADSNLNV